MSIGYPVKAPKIKPRLPSRAVHFEEKYDVGAIGAAVAQYDTTMAALGYLTGREVEPERYPDFDGTYSWAEHSARRMASRDPNALRAYIKDYLGEQGLVLT